MYHLWVFNGIAISLDHIGLKDKMIIEYLIGKDVEDSSSGLIGGIDANHLKLQC